MVLVSYMHLAAHCKGSPTRTDVAMPRGHKDPTYELPKPKAKKPSTAMSKAEKKRRLDARNAKAKAEREALNMTAREFELMKKQETKPRAAPTKRKEHPLRAKVKQKKRRK